MIGLAVLAACVVAGTAGARDGRRRRRRPERRRSPVQSPQCSNEADDDADGAHGCRRPGLLWPTGHHRVRDDGPPEQPSTSTTTTTTTPPSTTTTAPSTTTTTTPPTTTTDDPGRAATASSPAPPAPAVAATSTGPTATPASLARHHGDRHGGRDHDAADDETGGTRDPADQQPDRRPDGVPTDTNPTPHRRRLRPGADRRPQLRHRPVHDPALPAADLPGLRNPVRDPLAGARLDQPDRDRVRHQPQRLHRRRARLDAVHPLDLEDVRRRRQRRRPQGSLQPGRRDLRRGPLPEGRRRRHRPAHARSSPTTTPTGTSTRSCSTRNQYGKLPEDLISSLTGLTEGAHFPVAADARYADDISERQALKRSKPGKRAAGNAADVISGSPTRRGINIYSRDGRPGRRRQRRRDQARSASRRSSASYIVLQDAYGNRFTYAAARPTSPTVYPVPKPQQADRPTTSSSSRPTTTTPRRAGQRRQTPSVDRRRQGRRRLERERAPTRRHAGPVNTEDSRDRLYAYPERKHNLDRAGLTGQLDSLLGEKMPGYETFKGYFADVLRFDPQEDGAASR